MSGIGVMICGHGSRDEAACDEFRRVVDQIAPAAARMAGRHGLSRVRPADHPRRPRTACGPAASTASWPCPGMLFAAGHVKNDVPSVLNAYAAEHGLRLDMGRDLGIDAKLLAAARDRIDAALADVAESDIGLDETCLVVVGRGTSDSDANGNVAKVARMLWEGMGFAPCRDRLFGRRPPAHRGGAGARGPAGLPADRRVPLLPVHRCAGAADLRGGRRWWRHGIRRSSSSRRATSTTTRW